MTKARRETAAARAAAQALFNAGFAQGFDDSRQEYSKSWQTLREEPQMYREGYYAAQATYAASSDALEKAVFKSDAALRQGK